MIILRNIAPQIHSVKHCISPKESRFISFQADGPHLSSFVHSQPKVYARYASEQTYSCKNSMVRLSTKQKQHPPGNMNCFPSSRQSKKYNFFLPVGITCWQIFTLPVNIFRVSPLVLLYQASSANVCCYSN